jgi:hypothetical protein
MSDFLFVVKCFIFTIMITLILQISYQGVTLETRVDSYLKKSTIAHHLQDAAAGGASLALKLYAQSAKFIQESVVTFKSTDSQKSQAAK